jgi:hypothetical protein
MFGCGYEGMGLLPRKDIRRICGTSSKKSIEPMGFGFSRALLSFAPSRLASRLCSSDARFARSSSTPRPGAAPPGAPPPRAPALLRPDLLRHALRLELPPWPLSHQPRNSPAEAASATVLNEDGHRPEARPLSGRWRLIWRSAPLVRLPVLRSTRCLCSASLAADRPCLRPPCRCVRENVQENGEQVTLRFLGPACSVRHLLTVLNSPCYESA